MSLRESPFPNGLLAGLHAVGWGLIFPCFWLLDRLIAGWMSTSLEREQRQEQECYLHPLRLVFGSIFFFIFFVLTTPFALLGFLLWAPLQAIRRPFSYRRHPVVLSMVDRNASWMETGSLSFGFVTANLCLLPDGIARFNNLGHTQHRASAIGRSIVQGVTRPHIPIFVDSPSSCGTVTPSSSLLPRAAASTYGSTTGPDLDAAVPQNFSTPDDPNLQGPDGHHNQRHQVSKVLSEVSSFFPPAVDVVCLQEVFDRRAAEKLARALAPLYGHVLYDVGVYACHPAGTCSSFKFLNSGLFLASRFPVLEAQYHCFPNGRGEDALAAKGLLCAKVDLSLQKDEKKMVGYVNCTHLHAPEGEGEVRFEQLNMLTSWIQEFQAVNEREDETVVFDVLCGDFNFDNISPDDSLEQSHAVFDLYTDPCRTRAGTEKPWVIGTLLNQSTLYEEHVRTPDRLQRTLESEEQRRLVLSPPVPLAHPEHQQPWVGRRIDYLLYRDTHSTEVEEFTFVTQLAGLTDHIPVAFRIKVSVGPEDT